MVASEPDSLAGQWLGRTESPTNVQFIIDLDDGPHRLTGSGRVFFSDGRPGAICKLDVPKNFDSVNIQCQLDWLAHDQAAYLTTDQVRERYQEYDFPDLADLTLTRDGEQILLEWRTPIGTGGSARLSRSDMDAMSALSARDLSWDEFKEFALSHTAGEMIFRGQPKTYKMRTAFHRTYRKDLMKFAVEDIPVVHRQLTARTKHLFNLANPLENGAFYNLLQHHGYPTPLLDWTYSPFVAAFFAYRRRMDPKEDHRKVRILAFDKKAWQADLRQLEAINFAPLHFSVLEALAIENDRAIPQQAISTLTNIDDIEQYIALKEKESGKQYLHAIDLDADDRPNVMAELSLMGITAGSLFPGLDGACEELMGRFFHHQVPPRPKR